MPTLCSLQVFQHDVFLGFKLLQHGVASQSAYLWHQVYKGCLHIRRQGLVELMTNCSQVVGHIETVIIEHSYNKTNLYKYMY